MAIDTSGQESGDRGASGCVSRLRVRCRVPFIDLAGSERRYT
jgi:hypothetical protein